MKKISSILLLMILLTATAEAGIIKGSIKDKQTKEPLTGATVQIAAINAGTVADLNGNYMLHVANGIYTITVTYIGYKPIELRDIKAEKETTLNFEMEADMQTLADVTITGRMKKNTEISVMTDQRRSWWYNREYRLNKSAGHKTKTLRKSSNGYRESLSSTTSL